MCRQVNRSLTESREHMSASKFVPNGAGFGISFPASWTGCDGADRCSWCTDTRCRCTVHATRVIEYSTQKSSTRLWGIINTETQREFNALNQTTREQVTDCWVVVGCECVRHITALMAAYGETRVVVGARSWLPHIPRRHLDTSHVLDKNQLLPVAIPWPIRLVFNGSLIKCQMFKSS